MPHLSLYETQRQILLDTKKEVSEDIIAKLTPFLEERLKVQNDRGFMYALPLSSTCTETEILTMDSEHLLGMELTTLGKPDFCCNKNT